jgi:hypothetical protein
MRSISVEPSFFSKRKCPGDFAWEIEQSANDDAIYVFSENFCDYARDKASKGGGSAAIRPYVFRYCKDGERPRAIGIPTGWSISSEGFRCLDRHVEGAINCAFDRLINHLDEWPEIQRIVYSCDPTNTCLIGTGIFKDTIGFDVVNFISKRLQLLPSAKLCVKTYAEIEEFENKELYRIALLIQERSKLIDAHCAKDKRMKEKDDEIKEWKRICNPQQLAHMKQFTKSSFVNTLSFNS